MAKDVLEALEAASPQRIVDLFFGYTPTLVLSAAVQLDLFSVLAAGSMAAPDVAKAVGVSARGAAMLLDALVSLELLDKQGNRYGLTAESQAYLVKGSEGYLGGFFEVLQEGLKDWSRLAEAVRTGKPARSIENQKRSEEFFPPLIRALHVANMGPAHNLARKLGVGTRWRGLKILDVAAGSGVWGVAAAQEDPSSTVAALDYPGILSITREYVAKSGVADRFEYIAADLRDARLEENAYDLALLGNICHSEGEEGTRALFRKLQPSIRPGGKLAVVDMIPNDERTAPPFPLIFALQMLLHTEQGGTYTQAEYTRWLEEAGFKKVEAVDIRFHSPIIVASK